MTIKDFVDNLIQDSEITISVQQKIDGKITEIYNDNNLFNKNIAALQDKTINLIKIENKHIYIVVNETN